ncbi:unnamed protein product (macronuclear) [Paramecium tetraurelia]|uniref:Transmembrane protein n=1 Tax=Paramecium tetraurelia TaxID=5888 RepID=A0DTZ4_PARTE|nr:uncharacterized protein GSPATT00020195001 [Paramecium tetraurelia]CAK86511.1 unnamed protein product [Paramecium tetraurelia]|eukprot:XP_001453908.1 hypothetical protein (macronuclear) [Paramecium tetraurelia strain d4-2]
MNKFSLKFKDKDLESLYQSFLLEKIQYPVFMVLGIFSIVILGIKNIDGLINNNQSQFTLKIVGFCVFLVVSIISFCYKKFTRIGFYVINHFLMLYQINQRENVVQHTYLFGQNQMFVHSVVMLVSDFPDGILTNFTWTVIRMTIANTLDTNLDYQDQIYSIAVFFCLCLCIYIKNVHLRKAYMFSIRDSSWEVLLPQLISKPTFIFTCNEEKQQFQISRMIQMHFLMNIENPLLHFLRNTRLGNKTLEQYIWDKAKQRQNTSIRYTIEKLSVHYNKKQQQITFSECLLDTVTFILVIDSEDKGFIELRKKQQSIQEQHTNQILKVFKSQQNILRKGLKEKSFDLFFDLNIAMMLIEQDLLEISEFNKFARSYNKIILVNLEI